MSNVVLRGANELPGPRGFQIGVTLDALRVVGCFRFVFTLLLLFLFFFFFYNNEKCALKIPASEVVQFSKDSDGIFVF